jgi:hypothetical protein
MPGDAKRISPPDGGIMVRLLLALKENQGQLYREVTDAFESGWGAALRAWNMTFTRQQAKDMAASKPEDAGWYLSRQCWSTRMGKELGRVWAVWRW